MATKYRAGMTWVTTWISPGMLAMGKMKPESRNAGRNVATMANWLARNWLLVAMLISMPIAQRAGQEDQRQCRTAAATLPRSGTWKRNSPISTARSTSNMPMAK